MREEEKYVRSEWWSAIPYRLLWLFPQREAFMFTNNYVDENGKHINIPMCNCGHKHCPNPGIRDTEQTRLFAQKQMIDRAKQEMYDHFRSIEIGKRIITRRQALTENFYG